jgi:hypothetical protein
MRPSPPVSLLPQETARHRHKQHQADIMSHHFSLLSAERTSQRMNVEAAVFMSKPSAGIAESPMPGKSGAITVNRSASLRMSGLHMREVSAVAVDQDHRQTMPSSQVVQGSTFDGRIARGNTV